MNLAHARDKHREAPRTGQGSLFSPAKSLPSELMKLLPLGASLVALDRLERLLGRHPEAKPTEHYCFRRFSR